MKSLIQRGLAFIGAIAGAVTGQILSKNTHVGYPLKLIAVSMLSGALVTLGAHVGQRLEQYRAA